MVDEFHAPTPSAALGHRRNHAKGICFTGVFESNGTGASLSKAMVFAKGSYPVLGRLNLGTPNPTAVDGAERVRGIGIRIATPDGQEWRSAMIDAPFFPVATPQAFFDLLIASDSKDKGAMPAFAAAHPEIAAFGAWANSAPWTASYAEDGFNGLNTFLFVDASGGEHPVRWSLAPQASPVSVSPADLAKWPPDFLEQEITARVAKAPVRWTMTVTVADNGDQTADPSQAWPAGRRTVDVGTLIAQQVQPEADGACRDINYDPTVLPNGITTTDDPFPAARSAVYAKSFDRRTAESADYPRTAAKAATETKP